MNCSYCNKPCKSDNSLRNHQRLCPSNIHRIQNPAWVSREPWNKGLTKESDERVANNAASLSKATKGKPSRTIWTDEMRKAKSEWRKQLHLDHPESHPNRKLAGNRNKMSYPEKVAFDYLTQLGIVFEHQKQVGKYFPDFVIGSSIIEIDGARWHDTIKDQVRDTELEALGYAVHRIDSKEHIETRIDFILKRC